MACLIISIAVALLGEKYKAIGPLAWAALGGMGAIVFKGSIRMIANKIVLNMIKKGDQIK
ncbi:hypothetical protein D3C85_1852430 [compost metagenome]